MSVIFFPKTDRFIRLGQFLQDKALFQKILKKNVRYVFQRIDFDPRDVETMEDLHHQLAEQLNFARITSEPLVFNQWLAYLQKHDITLILIFTEAEKFLNDENKIILTLLTQLLDNHLSFIRTFCLFEADITHPLFLPILPSSPRIYENIYKYPLYDHDEALSFVRLFARQWDYTMTKKQEEEIFSACGGHLWLIKEAVREMVAKGEWSLLAEGMMFRLRAIYDLLLPSEQEVFQKAVTNKKATTPEEKHSEAFLRSIRVLDNQNNHTMGIYKDWLAQKKHEMGELMLRNDRIVYNDISLEKFFSRQENRVMKLLLRHHSEVISRDEVATSIWPTNTQQYYSDWAIDKLISRLRKRLKELSLPSSMIQSLRGKGYLLNLP